MREIRELQMALFPPVPPPPLAGSAKLEFSVTLECGETVAVRAERDFEFDCIHFEFESENISLKGNKAYFTVLGEYSDTPDDKMPCVALEIAEDLRSRRLEQIAREARKRGRKKC